MGAQKIDIREINLGSVGFNKIRIDQIEPGTTKVNSLEVRGSKVNLHMDGITLRGIRIDLKLLFQEDYKVAIDYVLGHEVVEGQKVSLGELMFYFDVGDINLPFPDTEAAFDELVMRDVGIKIDTIKNLILPAMKAENIQMSEVSLPLAGITLTGIGLGEASVRGVRIPDAKAKKIRFGKVHGASANVPSISIPGVSLEMAARDVEAKKTSAKFTDEKSTPWITITSTPLLTLTERILVRTEVALTIDKIILKGIKSKAIVGPLLLKNLVLPFNLLGIEMEDILITKIDIPTLGYK